MGFESVIAPIAGALIGQLFAPKKQDAAPAALAAPTTPAAAPQASAAPNVAALGKSNAAAASAQGPSSTLLTGLAGVPNSSLTLGKNQVLGQ